VREDRVSGLHGKRVVVTRAAEQSKALVRALEAKGATAVVLPMMAFGPPDDIAALDRGIREMGSCDWIFVTSQNSLRALQERCQVLELELKAATGQARVAAVGPATAEALRLSGIEVAHTAIKHQGVSLAQELAGEVKGKTVFLPRSNRANPELVEQLESLGASVKEAVAYKTLSPDEAAPGSTRDALERGADAILFFSPSAVRHLQDILGNERVLQMSRDCVFAAIGPVTEKALRSANIKRILVAEDATVAAIVRSLEKHFSLADLRSTTGVNPA